MNNGEKGEVSSEKGKRGIKGPPPGPRCFECQGYGHLARECINKLKKKTNYKANITWDDDSDSEISEEGGEEYTNFIAFGASLHSQTSDKPINSFEQGSSDDSDNEVGGEFEGVDDLRESYDRLYRESVRINKVNLKLTGKCQDINVELLKTEKKLGEQQGLLLSVTEERDKLRKEAVDLNEKNRVLGELNTVYEGSKALDDMLNSQRSPSDKSGLGFYGTPSSHEQRKNVNEKKPMEGHIRPNCFRLHGYPSISNNKVKYNNIVYNKRINSQGDIQRPWARYTNCDDYRCITTKPMSNKVSTVDGVKTRRIWVRSHDLHCMVVHTALKARDSHMWYLDSGCSRHMSGDKSFFVNLEKYNGGIVTFGDGSTSKVVGRGTIQAPGLTRLENVLYVDGLKANLISISQMCDSHHEVRFSKNDCYIVDEHGNSAMHGTRTPDNCYGILPNNEITCHSTQVSDTELWHQRLGHINYKGLSILTKRELIRGVLKLSKPKNHICGPCQLGKQIKAAHKKTTGIATKRHLELLHMDLMGPSRVESIACKKYIFVIVDDFSRFTWVRFLREKSEIVSIFKVLVKHVQNEKEMKIGCITRIRSDHGTEFENSEYANFCDELGIRHEFSTPKTPQQNGVVERKNHVIQEMARVMLHAKKIARRFWAEAVHTACYVINRVYLRPGTSNTPYELWKGKRPNVEYFRTFGSKCYIMRDREKLGKFDSRSDEGIFLGYSIDSRAFRVYNKRTQNVMESINVVVDENPLIETDNGINDLNEPLFEQAMDDVPDSSSNDNEQDNEEPKDEGQEGDEDDSEQPDEEQNLEPSARVKLNHPTSQVIGKVSDPMKTRRQTRDEVSYTCYLSLVEPKNVKEALMDECWINAMHEELHQFERNNVWELVPRPSHMNVIGTKWIFKNKSNEQGVVVRNKARLVA
ncbi:hypothetical protein RHGRI_029433 [Rhododendron griersonianum]|uniref:Gag-pol polyprotein n=1 Tax=Rhododendron griersonianum TaxID=479676 RepID=A0AAV6IML0_9ERIC|nr:hypothetical protein RHGRI_029433 [Rhododendron griersonianum]